MDEKILLNETCYKTNLSEGIRAFVLFYLLNPSFFFKFTKEELLDVIVNELKVKENYKFESLLIEIIETFDRKYEEFDFTIARQRIVEILLMSEKLLGNLKENIDTLIMENANGIKKSHRIDRKVLDYLDNQLFYKIIDCCYLIVKYTFSSGLNLSIKKKIEISEKTYDIIHT